MGTGRRVAFGATVLMTGAFAPHLAVVRTAIEPSAASTSTSIPSAPTPSDQSPGRETATITRRDLTESEEFDGKLGYGSTRKLTGAGGGTITALPSLGSIVHRGEVLWEIDGNPGPALLRGARPMWRSLHAAVTNGADVRQLEENLVALGFGADITPDTKFESKTVAAIKAWQKARGVKVTGTIEMPDVVFSPTDVRVAEQLASIGSRADGDILAVSSTQQVITVDLKAKQADLLRPGDKVEVKLPDGSLAHAVVYSIGKVATTRDNGLGGRTDPAFETIIATVDPVDGLHEAPVKVAASRTRATGVLTVPIRALLALAEGGYALERVTGATTELVGVQLGVFGDGVVEVAGNIAEGDSVVVAP